MIQAVPQHVNCCKHNILVLRSESLHENLVFNFNQPRMKMDQQMGSCKQLHVQLYLCKPQTQADSSQKHAAMRVTRKDRAAPELSAL